MYNNAQWLSQCIHHCLINPMASVTWVMWLCPRTSAPQRSYSQALCTVCPLRTWWTANTDTKRNIQELKCGIPKQTVFGVHEMKCKKKFSQHESAYHTMKLKKKYSHPNYTHYFSFFYFFFFFVAWYWFILPGSLSIRVTALALRQLPQCQWSTPGEGHINPRNPLKRKHQKTIQTNRRSPLKWRVHQDDCPGHHWRCWRQASTSPATARAVVLVYFNFCAVHILCVIQHYIPTSTIICHDWYSGDDTSIITCTLLS